MYNQEIMRILTNWLAKQHAYSITGQWHTEDTTMKGNAKGKHRILDVVIKKPAEPTIVLEFLATNEGSDVKAHLDKTPIYKNRVSAEAAWVIHFTREDDYLNYAYWPSDEILNEDVYMMHIWHNADFTEVWMSARWKDMDGSIQKIENQSLIV